MKINKTCHMTTSDRLWQNLNVLFFLRALTEQMSKKSSEPVVGHVKRKIGPLYFNKSQHSSELSTAVLYPDCKVESKSGPNLQYFILRLYDRKEIRSPCTY